MGLAIYFVVSNDNNKKVFKKFIVSTLELYKVIK